MTACPLNAYTLAYLKHALNSCLNWSSNFKFDSFDTMSPIASETLNMG